MKQEIKLAYFDCDGCLFDTPHPETGKSLWAKHHGKDYPHQGWWGRIESMDLDAFDIKPKEEVHNIWKDLYSKNFITRILTSRMPKFEPYIQSLLLTHDIDMVEIMTVKGSFTKGQRILQNVEEYINQGYKVTEVHFIDDRNKEIITVAAVLEELTALGVDFINIIKIESDAKD